MGHLFYLALATLSQLLGLSIQRSPLAHQLKDRANNAERIAQLMPENCKELILAPVRFTKRFSRLFALKKTRRLTSHNVEQPQIAFRRLVNLSPMIGNHAQDPTGAGPKRRGLHRSNV